jgi:hypothetical protein
MHIETLSCPTIVFCVEPTGAAIGESLTRVQLDQHLDSPLFLWAVHVGESVNTITPIRGCERVVAHTEQFITSHTISDSVAAVIADVLSLRDGRIPPMMERPVSLRLSLVGAAWEITPLLLSSFAAAFHSSAQQHVGARYFTEACFLLPDLMPSAPPGAAERVQELLRVIEGCPDSQDPGFRADPISYCWWFSRINASGLTLDTFPSSIDDIATVIHGLLSTAPEYLPCLPTILTPPPQHMSVGYGELFVARERVFEYLRARYACQLVQRLFLDKSNCVDRKRARQRAWAFTLSPECEGALREIELTPGGERIWKGFHPGIPEQVLEGEADEFLFNMRDSLDRFLKTDLARLRGQFELSGRSRRGTFLARLETEVQDIAERTEGGLFEAREFLEEVEAFLLETTDVSEGEKPMNLQEMRRGFDRAFAATLHWERSTDPNERGSKVQQLRQQLRQLTRLRNMSAPPALEPAIFEVLRWGEAGDAGTSLDQRIEETSRQLREEVASWAQEVAIAEQELQLARHMIEPEQERRAHEIERSEETLRQVAAECKKLRFELAQVQETPGWRWLDRRRQTRMLKEKNERLAQLLGETLPRQARQVVSCYAGRMELSIDRAVYEVRDNVIHDALGRVRKLHQRLVDAIDTLNGIRDSFGSLQVPTDGGVLRRSLIADVDLEALLGQLTQGLDGPALRKCPSAWDVCCQSTAKTEQQLREAAREPFAVVLTWVISDFLRLLGPQSAKLEALFGWLKCVSQPLFQPTGDTVDYSIVRTVDEPGLARLLRHAFREAVWIDDQKTPAVVVLQLRQIPRADASALGFSNTVGARFVARQDN